MTEKEKIIDKIKKLFALSRSNHIAEAENAMRKAHELLVKHHLEIKDIDNEFIEYSILKNRQRIPDWLKLLTSIVSKYFYCDFIIINNYFTGKRFVLIGKDLDVKLSD